jgi:hypothetical protein
LIDAQSYRSPISISSNVIDNTFDLIKHSLLVVCQCDIDRLLVLQPVSSVTNKSVIPEVFYRESIAEYGFPIKDFGNDERLVGYELTGCNTSDHISSGLFRFTLFLRNNTSFLEIEDFRWWGLTEILNTIQATSILSYFALYLKTGNQ